MWKKVIVVQLVALGLIGCGEATQDPGASESWEDANAGPVEGSPGRRGELHRILDSDPGNSEALSELRALDEQSDAEFGLVYQVKTGPGGLVKFFEPSPGRLLVLEKSPLEGHPSVRDRESIESVWANISDEPIPDELLEVRDRARALANDPPSTDDKPSSPSRTPSAAFVPPEKRLSHAGTAEHFENDHNGCEVLHDDVLSWCLTDRTGNSTKAREVDGNSVVGHLAQFAGNQLTWFTRWGKSRHLTTVRRGEHWNWFAVGGIISVIFPIQIDEIMEQQILDAQLNVDNWHWGGSVSDSIFGY